MTWFNAIKSALSMPATSSRHARPRLEALEDRLVMDARAVVVNLGGVSVLSVQGTESHDEITLTSSVTRDGRSLVTTSIVDRATGGSILVASHDASTFSAILVDGQAGNDVIRNNTLFRSTLLGGEGNDTLIGGHNNDVLRGGNNHDVLIGMGGDDTLDGGPGSDTYRFRGSYLGHDRIEDHGSDSLPDTLNFSDLVRPSLSLKSFSSATAGITINLTSTATQNVFAGHLSLTLVSPWNLEKVIGTRYDDVIRGNHLNNRLEGGDGNDLLEGSYGDDTLVGGRGNDTYLFAGAAVDHAGRTMGTDTLIELPGEGNDTLDFATFTRGVKVDLALAENVAYFGVLNLRLNGMEFENVIGTATADELRGNHLHNRLDGRGGDDTLEGRGGDDELIGGHRDDTYVFAGFNLGSDRIVENANQGRDTLDFSAFSQRLRVIEESRDTSKDPLLGSTDYEREFVYYRGSFLDLSYTGTQRTGGDQLTLTFSHGEALEDVIGTRYSDLVLGNSLDNRLYLGAGDDIGFGGDGNDRLYGGAGNDHLFGDDGDDWLYGGTGDDRLRGEGGSDYLYGQGGNDDLDGWDGWDYLDGGAGDDSLADHYSNGDTLIGGDGWDYFWRASLLEGSGSWWWA